MYYRGQLVQKSKISNPIREMYNNANLKPGQAIININVTYTKQIYFLAIVLKVTSVAHGTIIEYVNDSNHLNILNTNDSSLNNTSSTIQTNQLPTISQLKASGNKFIGNPSKLSNFEYASLIIEGNDIDVPLAKHYQKEFIQQLNLLKSQFQSKGIYYTNNAKKLHLTLHIENIINDKFSCYATYTDLIENKIIVIYNLGHNDILGTCINLMSETQKVLAQ